LLAALFLSGCWSAAPQAGPLTAPTTENGSPAQAAAARQTAQAFLDAWQAGDIPRMYALVTRVSQDALSLEDFSARYQDASEKMALTALETETLAVLAKGPSSAQVSYRAVYHSALLGELHSQMSMDLVLDQPGGEWRVQWDDGLIHDQLSGGNHLSLEVSVPSRGNIYDRFGHALAAFTDATALGVVPGKIDAQSETRLLDELSELTGKSREQIRALYENANPDWYIPVGEVSSEAVQQRYDELTQLPGLQMNSFRARFYYDGSVAPHVVGYLQPIPAERAAEYALQGYLADEKVGAAGLEAWGEPSLRGRPRASLYVVSPQGQTITRLAQADAQPAQSLYTTLDKDLQSKIQKSMGNYRGAVVVMERDSGRIVAMVSNPAYDANIFEPTNLNSNQLDQVINDPDTPLLNRAAQGVYPLGSVFKTITMAAGLESGLFAPDSEYSCGYVFDELPVPFYDWTYEHGVASSGILDLAGGLIRSCNPWFWHIGLDLYNQPEHKHDIEKMAHAFGLGQPTGTDQLIEAAGSVPTPGNEYQAIGLAIGQDELQVTPLQVVTFMAALGNGGTLYRPQLVEKIAPLDGTASYTFKPERQGKLPISPGHLKVIQDALFGVIHSTEPLGTAHFVLANVPIPTAGKTGTAQTASDPHAWFAGYTLAGQADRPDIAVAVILENAGEGSLYAAPIFRRIVQLYFSDNQDPGALLPWESSFYQVATPEPAVTPTASP